MLKKELSKRFGTLLKDVRRAREVSQEKLALDCGLDRTYISMLERGLKSPTLNTIFSIAEALDIPAEFLIAHTNLYQRAPEAPMGASLRMPLLGTALSCGMPVGTNQEIEKEIDLQELITKNPSKTFFAKAQGDSMQPTIMEGDVLVIDAVKKPKHGSIVLVQIDNEFTVKRLMRQGTQTHLQADNPLFRALQNLKDKDYLICGVVVSIVRLDP